MIPKLENYSIIREIGSGGTSVVFEATDHRLKRTVALKMLHPHLCKEEDATARFKREALAAARMDHPQVVRIYEYFFELDAHYIAMEYVPGTDMDTVLRKKGNLGIDAVAAVMGEIAGALSEAHGWGIIHRDIKPANILIHKQGRAMLSDFGLAFQRLDTHLTIENMAAGTPSYMSPEQISCGEVGPASDVYSWAVTFYTLLTGRFPYNAQRFPDIISEIQQAKTCFTDEARASLPTCYYELLKRCLHFSPEERIGSGTELKELIAQCRQKNPSNFDCSRLVDGPLSESSGTAAHPASKTSFFIPAARSRKKRLAALVGVPMIVLVACIASFFSMAHKSIPTPAAPLPSITAGSPLSAPPDPTRLLPKRAPVVRSRVLSPQAHKAPLMTPAAPSIAPSVADSGRLFVYCNPWATVYINDRDIGNTPFEKPVSLPAGVYRIRLFNKHFASREDTVRVTPGTILRKRYSLQLIKG